MRISGETNSPPGWPNLHRAGPGGGEKNIEKEGPKLGGGPLFSSVFLGWPALMPRGCIFPFFLNKTPFKGPFKGYNAVPPLQLLLAIRQNRGNYKLPRHQYSRCCSEFSPPCFTKALLMKCCPATELGTKEEK